METFFTLFAIFCCSSRFFPVMAPKPHWSHAYFTKNNETGKFECNFGCGAKYVEKADEFTHHLLVSLHFNAIFIHFFRINVRKLNQKLESKSTRKQELTSQPPSVRNSLICLQLQVLPHLRQLLRKRRRLLVLATLLTEWVTMNKRSLIFC